MIPRRVVIAVAAVAAVACMNTLTETERVPGGDVEAGRVAIVELGCIGCHHVPGVEGPQGRVGPSLEGVAQRRIIAGTLPNNPENLMAWILDPPAIDADTVMPDLVADPDVARDIAAYLYSLD